jgi:hypothetical protein
MQCGQQVRGDATILVVSTTAELHNYGWERDGQGEALLLKEE